MPSPLALLATAALALFFFSSHATAFSPDQCNLTTYGAPNKAACSSLLTHIASLGGGKNTSYLFIPKSFPTPAGMSNGTRVNFPVSWSTPGCEAALVPIEVTDTTVTYDTSSYPDLASVGKIIAKECLANSTGAGGWELAGDSQNLVLHLFATGSEIEQTIKMQTSSNIAATSEDTIEEAELDDPDYGPSGNDSSTAYNGTYSDSSDSDDDLSGIANGTGDATSQGGTAGAVATTTKAATPASTPNAGAGAAAGAAVVGVSGTFNYLGCQMDHDDARTLSNLSWSGTGLTVERCATYCQGYQYMGVEFGSECYCGGDANGKGVKPATIVTATKNNCTMACNGDKTQICGGTGWLSTYQNSQSASAGVTA